MNRRSERIPTVAENDPFFFLTSDSIFFSTTDSPSSSSIFSNLFSNIFNNIIEVDRFNEAVQNSMETYNDELFKKVENRKIDLPLLSSLPLLCRMSTCLICTGKLIPQDEDDPTTFYELPCHHVYHASCLQEAVAHQHYQCCLCQEKIPLRSKENPKEEYNHNGHRITISLDY